MNYDGNQLRVQSKDNSNTKNIELSNNEITDIVNKIKKQSTQKRNKLTLKIFNSLSNNIKIKIASYLRGKSKKITSQKPENIMDVNEKEVLNFYERFGTDIIIHGHTHRPEVKYFANGSVKVVLGSWEDKGWVFEYDSNHFDLRSFVI